MSDVVTLVEPDARQRVRRVKEQLEATFRPRPGDRFALKPNLSSYRPSETGATTDHDLVRAVVEHLHDHRAVASIVELPPHIRNLDRVARLSGYRDLARELGVELVIPDRRREFVSVGRLFGVFPCRVARAAWDSDGIVNMPKVKTHMRAHFTAAVKNLIGLTDIPTRHRIHVWGLHRGIAQMYRAMAPKVVFNLLDATVAMEGQGPTRGDPRRLDTVLLARDGLEADLQAAALFGVDLGQVHYLRELAGPDGGGQKTTAQTTLRPVHNPHPSSDYLREALTTQPVLRRLLQRLDVDFITDKRPVLPADGPSLDHLCPHGAISDNRLDPELCNTCYRCLEPGGPVTLERGRAHKLRVLRDLWARVPGRG